MGESDRPVVFAIRQGAFVELYDKDPFDQSATRLADFLADDFETYLGVHLDNDQMCRVRLTAKRGWMSKRAARRGRLGTE